MILEHESLKLSLNDIHSEYFTNSFRMTLQDAVTGGGGQAAALQQMASLGELSQAELSNIVGLAEPDGDDPDDILKQLGETAFDNFDTFFTDLTNSTATPVPPIEIKVCKLSCISKNQKGKLKRSSFA